MHNICVMITKYPIFNIYYYLTQTEEKDIVLQILCNLKVIDYINHLCCQQTEKNTKCMANIKL